MIETLAIEAFDKDKERCGYELSLPSIYGKTFTFKPGLNLLVGKNGSGKSSLLNVIKKMTFCEKKIYSEVGEECWHLKMRNYVEDGLFHRVALNRNWKNAVFNLRTRSDLGQENAFESATNLSQMFYDNTHSDGERVFGAMNMLFGMFVQNSRRKVEKENLRNYEERVTKYIQRDLARFTRNGKAKTIPKKATADERGRASHEEIEATVLDYYEKHHVEKKGYTFLLDEPDKGLDVFNLKTLYEFLKDVGKCSIPLQYICVLHNVAVVEKFVNDPNVNIIEMTDGYADAVRDFMKG